MYRLNEGRTKAAIKKIVAKTESQYPFVDFQNDISDVVSGKLEPPKRWVIFSTGAECREDRIEIRQEIGCKPIFSIAGSNIFKKEE